jgi:hypothetical protein
MRPNDVNFYRVCPYGHDTHILANFSVWFSVATTSTLEKLPDAPHPDALGLKFPSEELIKPDVSVSAKEPSLPEPYMKMEGSEIRNIMKPRMPIYFKNWKKITAPAPCSIRSPLSSISMNENRPVFVPKNGRKV